MPPVALKKLEVSDGESLGAHRGSRRFAGPGVGGGLAVAGLGGQDRLVRSGGHRIPLRCLRACRSAWWCRVATGPWNVAFEHEDEGAVGRRPTRRPHRRGAKARAFSRPRRDAASSRRFYNPEKDWGAISSPDLPDGLDAWIHFGAIEADGYRSLDAGDQVDFDYEPARQDSFQYRATRARKL